MASFTAGQGPAGSLVVKVNVTVPAVTSAALGVYIAVNVVLFGLYAPVPPDHVADVALPPLRPASVTVLPAQIIWSAPAFTVAAGFIVITIASLTARQGPAGSSVVNVSVTVPAVTSAALGVYTAFSVVLLGAYVPVPPVQVALDAPPPITPASVAVLPAQ